MKTKGLNVFCDLDGFIFEYNMSDYLGSDPAYTKPGYFRHRKEDKRACSMFKDMAENREIASLNILSRGATRLSYEKQVAIVKDKIECVKDAFPWLDESNIFVTHQSKVESAESILGRKLEKSDVLIDDYNENLIAWRNAGGTAIKYINGINSVDSYSGAKLVDFDIIDVPEDEVEILTSFASVGCIKLL